jgi:hypothetical protein
VCVVLHVASNSRMSHAPSQKQLTVVCRSYATSLGSYSEHKQSANPKQIQLRASFDAISPPQKPLLHCRACPAGLFTPYLRSSSIHGATKIIHGIAGGPVPLWEFFVGGPGANVWSVKWSDGWSRCCLVGDTVRQPVVAPKIGRDDMRVSSTMAVEGRAWPNGTVGAAPCHTHSHTCS